MPRVEEVAEELGLSSQEVLARLEAMGQVAAGRSSSIDDQVAERLRSDVRNGAPAPAQRPEPPGAGNWTKADPLAGVEQPTGKKITAEMLTKPGAEPQPDEEPKPQPPTRKPKKAEDRGGKRLLKQLSELPILILLAFGIAVLIKTFLVQAFFIPSGSMRPALENGDRVLVEKLSYRFGDPERGQVIVFAKSVITGRQPDEPWQTDVRNFIRELVGMPTGREEDYIKRIVALGGDTILYEGQPRRLVVNGERVREPYVKGVDRFSAAINAGSCSGMQLQDGPGNTCRVPAGRVFVMGDNRGSSQDSRIIGPIQEDKIVGQAFVVIWPLDHFKGL